MVAVIPHGPDVNPPPKDEPESKSDESDDVGE